MAVDEVIGALREVSAWQFATTEPTCTLNQLTEWALSTDADLLDLEVSRRSLEDVYFS